MRLPEKINFFKYPRLSKNRRNLFRNDRLDKQPEYILPAVCCFEKEKLQIPYIHQNIRP